MLHFFQNFSLNLLHLILNLKNSKFSVKIKRFYTSPMNSTQIELNLQKITKEFSPETFIYDLLLAYGLPKHR